MGVLSNKRQLSLAALLLTFATFAMSPPDAFCRTQAGNRSRASRTVRLDDHDHDYSPDLRTDDHTSGEHVDLILIPEAPVEVVAALTFAGMVETLGQNSPAHSSIRIARGRAPPASA